MKNIPKLYTDPRTANLMKDKSFESLLMMCMKDQNMLMQMLGKDPRFNAVFSVLTGLDLDKMSEEAAKSSDQKEKSDKEWKKKSEEVHY